MKTRQLHFIKWCVTNKLSDPTMASMDLGTRNFIMACYTASLVSNGSIFCKTIKAATISNYLSDAAKLSIMNRLQDPTKTSINQRSPYIRSILHEHKRWESMPNRREPLTYNMVNQAIINNTRNHYCTNSLNSALTDWFILGMVTGARKSEWCQDRSSILKSGTVTPNIDGSSSAFIFSDFIFEDINGIRRNNDRDTAIFDAEIVKIKWRFQKNNMNGQVLSYTANHNNPALCPVRAAMRIRQRAMDLKVPPSLPLAVFQNGIGHSQYIDDKYVETLLRQLATQVYNITDTQELSRFTCHSIRVGACVLLHEANAKSDFIKFRLRWNSDSYLMYLRNTPKLAHQHNMATNFSSVPTHTQGFFFED